jgi:hypothetical protein
MLHALLLLGYLLAVSQDRHPLQGEWVVRYSTSEGENDVSIKVGNANGGFLGFVPPFRLSSPFI